MLSRAIIALLLLVTTSVVAADSVTVATGTDNARRRLLSGTISEFNGRELRIELTNGQTVSVPTDKVLDYTSTWTAAQQEAEQLVREHKYAAALEAYRRAVTEEQRPWARRKLLADVVTCYENHGQIDRAGDAYLLLSKQDEQGQYADRIPLAWLSGLTANDIEAKAKSWLASESSPAAQLLGASWLLSSPQRAAAVATLRKLASHTDPRIAHLADAQLWRANIATVGRPELDAWKPQIERMPANLRAGPYLILAKGLTAQEGRELKPDATTRQAAAWNYLRAPLLFPERHALAAQGLEGAAAELVKLEQLDDATRLYDELAQGYADTQWGENAATQLKILSKTKRPSR